MPGQLRDQRTHKLGFLRRNVRRRLQLTQRLQRQAEAETSSSLPAKPSGKDSDIDNAECKFNVNSFKQVYVMNGDQCLYKCTALKRAHESHQHVSMKLHLKFSSWLNTWKNKNVSRSQEAACKDWLMGNVDKLRPCTTFVMSDNKLSQAPYYKYNRYRVHMPSSKEEEDEEEEEEEEEEDS